MTTSVKSNLVSANNNYRPNINNINGGGRPPGARTRLSHKLITDLSEIWHEHGPDVLRKMALRDPIALARMAYSTLPKDILVSVEQKQFLVGLSPTTGRCWCGCSTRSRAPFRQAAMRRRLRSLA